MELKSAAKTNRHGFPLVESIPDYQTRFALERLIGAAKDYEDAIAEINDKIGMLGDMLGISFDSDSNSITDSLADGGIDKCTVKVANGDIAEFLEQKIDAGNHIKIEKKRTGDKFKLVVNATAPDIKGDSFISVSANGFKITLQLNLSVLTSAILGQINFKGENGIVIDNNPVNRTVSFSINGSKCQ